MKKIIVLLSLVLLLTGCSNAGVAKVSDGDTVIFTGPNVTYTKQDLFDSMKNNDYSSSIASSVVLDIAKADGLDLTEEKETLEDQYDTYYQMLGSYATYYMGTKDEYVTTYLSNAIVEKYLTQDIEDNFDSYVEEYAPYYGEIFYVDSEDTAKAILDAVNSGSNTLEYAASENGYTDSITPTVYTDDSDLPVEVKELINSSDAPLLTSLAVDTYATSTSGDTTTTTRYYIINITSKTVADFKDDFITAVIDETDQTEYIQTLINKHEIRFYDQTSYDYFSSVYTGAK